MTEERAIAEGYEIKIGRFPFSASGKARAIGETEGLVKLISYPSAMARSSVMPILATCGWQYVHPGILS